MSKNVKVIVVACNTASALSLDTLKREFKIPVVGVIKPAVKRALEMTKNNKIGVIATVATVRSKIYEEEIHRSAPDVEVKSIACPLFVPIIEEGLDENQEIINLAIRKYLSPIKRGGIDTLILGCTHYPLIISYISDFLGESVKIIESGKEVAKELKLLINELGIFNNSGGRCYCYVSDSPEDFSKLSEVFLGEKIRDVTKVKSSNV